MSTRISSPADLLASVPACLGFAPTESVLVLGLHQGTSGRELTYVCRADLPHALAEDISMAGTLATRLRGHGVDQHILVAVSEASDAYRLPHRPLMDTVRQRFTDSDMAVVARYWLPEFQPGAQWRSYDSLDHGGVLPDPRSTVVAAELAARGEVTFSSRSELAGLLDPVADEILERRAVLLGQDTLPPRREQAEALRRATEAAAQGVLPEYDEDIVALLRALGDPLVRDACVAWNGPGVEQLWTHLTRHAPGAWAAEPAVLLAVASYRRGDGALANVACQRAHAANPHHRLGTLMSEVLSHGLHPSDLDQVISDTATETDQMLD